MLAGSCSAFGWTLLTVDAAAVDEDDDDERNGTRQDHGKAATGLGSLSTAVLNNF